MLKILSEITFKQYTIAMMVSYALFISATYLFVDIKETRSEVVGFFAVTLLLITVVQFIIYKNSGLYKFNMEEVAKKEPSMIYLALAGIAMGFLSDSKEPLVLALFLSCAMLNLKYVIMHMQLKNKLKELKEN